MRLLIIAIIFFIAGCASQAITGLLRLQDRELLIHPDKSGLAYPHNATECIDRKGVLKVLGKKCTTTHSIDFYDLNDKRVRENLINAGFTCKSKMRFQY